MIRAWPEKSLRPVWWPTVVMGAVLGEHGPQVPLTEDQDAVGEFGSGRQHESFGEAVRSRQRGGIFTVSMPASARTASNDVVN
jgi:hypothetical protein